MVDRRTLNFINGRLSQIKQIRMADVEAHFGKVAILAVGDFYQLPPVKAQSLLKPNSSDGIDLWHDNFKVFKLTEIMRQKDDASFAQLQASRETDEQLL